MTYVVYPEDTRKTYKPGQKLFVLYSDSKDSHMQRGMTITVREPREYKRSYDFEEAPKDVGWNISFIENTRYFRPIKSVVTNWKEEMLK